MELTLLTGGTGTLGRVVAGKLRDTGADFRVLSRRAHPESAEFVQGDLKTGDGIEAAVADVTTIIHCATSSYGDVKAAQNLVAAAGATRPHLVYVSIVGIDAVPMFYYRAKLDVERLIEESDLPYTIVRATQFHDLIASMYASQRRLPLLVVPAVSFQPIDVHDVADRLIALAARGPVGRVADIGGPSVRTAEDLAHSYLAVTGRRRRIVNLRLPGRSFATLRAGSNLAPDAATGTITFEEYLTRR